MLEIIPTSVIFDCDNHPSKILQSVLYYGSFFKKPPFLCLEKYFLILSSATTRYGMERG
jgi:hypothetical protein